MIKRIVAAVCAAVSLAVLVSCSVFIDPEAAGVSLEPAVSLPEESTGVVEKTATCPEEFVQPETRYVDRIDTDGLPFSDPFFQQAMDKLERGAEEEVNVRADFADTLFPGNTVRVVVSLGSEHISADYAAEYAYVSRALSSKAADITPEEMADLYERLTGSFHQTMGEPEERAKHNFQDVGAYDREQMVRALKAGDQYFAEAVYEYGDARWATCKVTSDEFSSGGAPGFSLQLMMGYDKWPDYSGVDFTGLPDSDPLFQAREGMEGADIGLRYQFWGREYMEEMERHDGRSTVLPGGKAYLFCEYGGGRVNQILQEVQSDKVGTSEDMADAYERLRGGIASTTGGDGREIVPYSREQLLEQMAEGAPYETEAVFEYGRSEVRCGIRYDEDSGGYVLWIEYRDAAGD